MYTIVFTNEKKLYLKSLKAALNSFEGSIVF